MIMSPQKRLVEAWLQIESVGRIKQYQQTLTGQLANWPTSHLADGLNN